jgi:hypothetical protein
VGLAWGLLWWGIWCVSSRRTFRGLRVATLAEDQESVLARVDAALELIERHDAATFRRVRQLAGILVLGEETYRLGHFVKSVRLCVLTERFLGSPATRPADVALALAHESMHAVLWDLGADYAEGRRAHIEVICVMAERALARRLPGEARLVEQSERRIEEWASGGEARWSSQARREAHLRYAREFGFPDWAVSLLDRWAHWINRLPR